MTSTVTRIPALPQIRRRKRTVAYARVSDGKDAMRHSLAAQISYYSALIQRRIEWEFAGVYADNPVSGTKDNRAEFQRMLADCRAGKIDQIITKSITRFARNTLTTLETIRELKTLGIDVYFEKEKIHSLSGDGELMLSILASYAQEESRSVSENCKWRIRKMFQSGRPTTGNMLGYRLVDGKFHIVPEEAEIVRQVFADYLSGMGKERIVKKLRVQGVFMSTSGLHQLLKNEKLTGDLRLQKSYTADHISKKKCRNHGELPQFYVRDSHEAIIGRTAFGAVQAEMDRRAANFRSKSKTTPESYPFTGKIRCGKCGAPYRRKHAAAGSKYEKIVWICNTFNSLGKSACSSQQIPEAILEAKATELGGMDCVTEILVPDKNWLTFILTDGSRREIPWQNPSRRESWTPEMKQAARNRQNKIIEERRCSV